jgi:hypothetical protein
MIRKMVVHCRHAAYDVLIDRTTKWGNLFTSIADRQTRAQVVVKTRAESLMRHEAWLRANSVLVAQLHELRDQVLGCWCDPWPCHGHTLIRLVDELCSRCDKALRGEGTLCAACGLVAN